MMMKKIQLLLTAALLLYNLHAVSQNDLLFMSLREVPQTSSINPAIRNPELFNVGVPFISSAALSYGNSGFRFNKLVRERSDDSLSINLQDFVNILGDKNYLNLAASYELVSGGYNWDKWYFTFSWSEKASVQFSYPKSLMGFILNGNGAYLDQTVEFTGLKLKALHYREWAFGAARPIDDKWTVGMKAKVLFGKSSIYTKKLQGSFFTDPETYQITTTNSIDVNRSLPEVFLYDTLEYKHFKYSSGMKNPGYAFDFGAEYKFSDKITFSASLLDLGAIRWKNNLKNYRSKDVSWTFKGIDVNDYIDQDDEVVDARIEQFQDSIIDRFGVKESETRFYTPLTPKLYLAANYIIDEHQSASAVLRTDFFNATLHTQLCMAYQYKINPFLTAAGSYSIAYRNVGNFGLGFVANYGPMQFYITTDNVVGLFAPASVRMTNVRLGFNYLQRTLKKPATAPRIN
jgi:hypothetical protein